MNRMMRMMRGSRWKSLLPMFPCLLLLTVACDRGEELDAPEDELEARTAEVEEAAEGERVGHHRGREGSRKIARLCEALECTEDQLARIEGLAERLAPPRGERKKGNAAAHRALADAFRGDALSTEALSAWRAAARPDPGERAEALVPAVVELHGILEPTQREALAGKIERRGLPFVGGKHHRGGKHRRGGDESASADRAARKAARMCERLGCEPAQQERIAALVQARPEPSEVPVAARRALAEAFRGASLGEADVRAYLDAAAEARAADLAAKDAQVVALHGLLTPAQRAAVADRVQEHGPRALGLGGGKGRHGKKKHRRGGKRRRPAGDVDGAPAQFG